ncbi:hypothetical protein DOK76_05740 [Vagococcus sp. DIV0080]|uniref:Niacin transporter NiaX n=1 Tax=Candidatus Vagococcus giribetii TaxID=2230876 RepID=A0ABS3HS18_9ENTE|nr:hypothetical protein [Vagococcus sp. DIV0080]MBO0476563.1 hypothetical protein [Vagococcus sp. DIV0080]
MKNRSIQSLTYASLLIALGIMIPLVMPVKFVIGPASFTLASHVPVFLAMFVSPVVAVLVALGTAFGFFLTFPFIVGMRALSHVIFAFFGALYLGKHPNLVDSPKKMMVFNVVIGLVHAICETLVVTLFFMTGKLSAETYTSGFFVSVFLLIGVGGFIHSLIDYTIAFSIAQKIGWKFKFPVYLAANKQK